MHIRTHQPAHLAVIMVVVTLFGCGQGRFSGVVQSSKWVSDGWELSLGTASTADYILVEKQVLLDLGGRVAVVQDPRNMLLLGSQYVGRKVRVRGEIQRDESNRRFIRVIQRDQIELL